MSSSYVSVGRARAIATMASLARCLIQSVATARAAKDSARTKLQRSDLFHPRDAIALRRDGSFDDRAPRRRLEMQAVAALLIAIGLVLVLHGVLGSLLLRERFLGNQARGQRRAGQDHRRAQHGAPRHLRTFILHATSPWERAATNVTSRPVASLLADFLPRFR